MNKRQIGNFYEGAVTEFLKNNGIEIIKRNYYCKLGEIDIIALDGDTLVFIEVKYRKNANYGRATEVISATKQKKIIKTAKYYLMCNNTDRKIRFDVVGITGNEIEWIQNAFEYIGE